MPEISWVAVALCGFATLGLGAIWYSPALFGGVWQREAGLSDEILRSGSMSVRFLATFVLALVAAATFALFVGTEMTVVQAAAAGACAGITWVMASFGTNYSFEHRSVKLWLVNGGFHAVQFTLFGAIIGAIQ